MDNAVQQITTHGLPQHTTWSWLGPEALDQFRGSVARHERDNLSLDVERLDVNPD